MRFEAEDLSGVLAAGERGRALGLIDLASGAALRAELSPDVLEELDGARTELEQAAIDLSDDRRSHTSGDGRYEHAAQRLRSAERAIRAVTPGLRVATIPPATVEALQRGPLANGAGLVVYSLPAAGDAMALCITSDTISAVAIKDGAARIRVLGAELALSLAARLGRPLHTHVLHDLLLGPVVEELGDRPLIVVPDAELHQIPFAVLTESPVDDHDETLSAEAMDTDHPRHADVLADAVDALPPLDWSSPAFAVARRSLRIVPSATILLQLYQRRPVDHALALVGVADPTPALHRNATDGLRALPFAREELRAIACLLGEDPAGHERFVGSQVSTRMGAAATRLGLEELLALNPRWVHIASHASIFPAYPWASRLVLAAEDGRGTSHFTPATVLRHRIDADLVTLSCCDTGVGMLMPGEGVLGFPRALLAVGAGAACVTLWPVLDAAGPTLMSHMYRQLLLGAGPADALRSAQVSAIRRGVHPEDWSAYVVVG
jgi:CHAT domain-containing protein